VRLRLSEFTHKGSEERARIVKRITSHEAAVDTKREVCVCVCVCVCKYKYRNKEYILRTNSYQPPAHPPRDPRLLM